MKIPNTVALLFIAGSAAIAYTMVDNAATKATDIKPYVWTKAACARCHTDLHSLTAARGKRGDATWLEAEYEAYHKGDQKK